MKAFHYLGLEFMESESGLCWKTVSMVLIVLLITSMSAGTFEIQSVRADGTTIYINADGTITPSTAPISTIDNITYAFTGNIANDSILVQRNNIVLDGNNCTLQGGRSGTGIYLLNMANLTVRNIRITGFEYGIRLMDSSNNTVSGNDATDNVYGIYLYSSSNNTFQNNTMANNTYNFGLIAGVDISFFVNYVDTSNTVDGKPVYYWIDKLGLSLPPNAGYVALVNCTDITVHDLNLTSNEQSILLAYTTNSTITQNNLTNCNYDGIELFQSSSNTVYGNNATNNENGIDLYYSSSCNVSGNYVTNNKHAGIYLYSSSNNIIYGNNATNNGDGIDLDYSSSNNVSKNEAANENDGISLVHSSNNTVSENNSTENGDNIFIFLGVADDNTVYGNDATNNVHGIYLYSSSKNTVYRNNVANNSNGVVLVFFSSNNTIFQNNFINNTLQVSSDGSPNTWDDAYPSGGNYWSDYNARYPNASGIDASGIWNTPYVVDANNTDRYPLKTQYIIPEFFINSILPLFIAATLMAVVICRKKAMRTSRN